MATTSTSQPSQPACQPSRGGAMHALMRQLFPLQRSITGDGVRETLRILQQQIPLALYEVPTGTRVFDWVVPQEWNIRGAYIQEPDGRRIVDYSDSNLHVVNYSQPISGRLPWNEIRTHVHSLPAHPDWIPYRSTYFQQQWGFCLRHRQLEQLDQHPDRQYDVCIDATFTEGSLTYGECHLPGASAEEVLLWCHICHPSLANDNLSGIVVATQLAQELAKTERKYSYRIVYAPATIGAITWLHANEAHVDRIGHGLVLTVLGGPGGFTYKRSRRGDAEIDRVVEHVLRHSGAPYEVRDFHPSGYDERQFCSPGFNLPVGCLMRTPHAEFAEYHTSADNLEFVTAEQLAGAWQTCWEIIEVLEGNDCYTNLSPKGEPRLGPRGLYRAYAEKPNAGQLQEALLWVLNLSDGQHRLLDIADRSGLPFAKIRAATDLLIDADLVDNSKGMTKT